MIDYINQIRQGNIDKKDEISMQIVTGFVEENNVTLGKKEFSYIKMTTTGFNLLLDKAPTVTAQTNTGNVAMPGERPKYSINPSELSKTAFTENNVKYVKYQFHELQTKQNPPPYADTKEPTGTVRIEIAVKEEESEDFEEYLYVQKTIIVEGIPYLSQLDQEDTKNKTGCTTGCCWSACCWMINQTGTIINNNNRVYFADPINVDNLADGIITIVSEQEFNETIRYIKNQLKLGKPVLCGTWDNRSKRQYKELGPNAWNDKLTGKNNSATTHFVVIMGYGYDKGQDKYYFRFYDPGRTDSSQGTSENNKFYIDYNNLEIINLSYRGKIYKVTEIRKNF